MLARRLGDATGLPVIHMDREYWQPGWVQPEPSEWASRVDELAAGDSWIMDGNYGGTMAQRLARADTIVFLDVPRSVCVWGALKRRVAFHGRPRPDMTEGCEERLTFEFLKWIWDYPATRRPGILAMLREQRAAGKVVRRLRSRRSIERFVTAVADDARLSRNCEAPRH